MQELNKVYERAQMDKDLLDIDCQDKNEQFSLNLQTSRALHHQSEATLTRIENRMEHTQMKSDSLQARLQEHTDRYHDHKIMCGRHRAQSEKELGLLEKDLPISKKLQKTAAKGCSSLTLLECEQSDGTVVINFDNAELKSLVGTLR